jgi:hypothetical protein
MLRARDTSNTATAHSSLPEIADSIDGRSVDDATDKHPLPLVFAEDENGIYQQRSATGETATPSFLRLFVSTS